jgi:hypothetical protein
VKGKTLANEKMILNDGLRGLFKEHVENKGI